MEELESEVFRMAAGGEEGCRLVRNEKQHCIEELVDTWEAGSKPRTVAEGQPLRLKLIRAILQAADDPDRDFLLQAEIGLPVGILAATPDSSRL